MRSIHNLSTCYRVAGKLDLALPLMEENVRLARAKFDPDHPFTLSASANLAATYQSLGKLENALPLLQEAAAGVEKRGFRHEHSGRIVERLCSVLEALNRFDDAQVWRQKWLEAVTAKSGTGSPAYAGVLAGIGENLLARKKWIEAEAALRASLAAFKKSPAATVPMFNVQSLLGRALAGQKMYGEAETLLVQAYKGLVAHEDEIPKTDLRRLAQAGESIVALYETWGRPGEAAEWRAKVARASKPTPAP